MWPQTLSGHAWRTRSVDNVVQEVKNALGYFPQMKEIFFDDDTFNIRKDRVIELSQKFKPLKFSGPARHAATASMKSLKAMADGGCALVHRGLRVRRRANPEEHQKGRDDRHGARVHEKLPQGRHQGATATSSIACRAKTKDTINKTIDFAKELDCEPSRFRWRTPCRDRAARSDVQGRFLARGSLATRVDTSCHTLSSRIFPRPI